jgi:acetyl-CoA carboxylase biotin carboxyl carrier protein
MKVGPRRPLAPDADVIRALAGLLSETGLSEIEYAVGDHRIRVARESAGKTVLVNGHVNGSHANGAEHPPAPAREETTEAPMVNQQGLCLDHPGLITAPLVGIAYLAPQPGAPLMLIE